jgi:hypothetical protein
MSSSPATPPLSRAATALAAAFWGLLLLPAAAVTAQPPPPQPNDPEYTRAAAGDVRFFRAALMQFDFKTLKSFGELKPNNTILIVLGDTRRLTEVPGGLTNFLEQGGAALIASDKPMQPAAKVELVRAAGVSVGEMTWYNTVAPGACYKGLSYCPYLQWNDPQFMTDPKIGKLKVAMNVPATLVPESVPPQFARIPALPPNTFFPEPKKGEQRPADLVGVVGEVGSGRVIVLADHSIFIDEMMAPTDIHNAQFTANCLTYLRGDENQHTNVLLVVDGVITDEPRKSMLNQMFNLLKQGVKRADDAIPLAEEGINDLDKQDAINRWVIQRIMDKMSWNRFLFAVFVVGTLLLLIYGCYRLGIASRVRTDRNVPTVRQAVQEQAPGGSFIEQRHEALLETRNIWEALRQLARDVFESVGISRPVPYRGPKVTVNGSWWGSERRAHRVYKLWRLAFDEQPMPFAPHTALSIAAELESLKADLKSGTVTIA